MHKKEQIRLLKGLIHHLDNKTNIDAGGIIRTPADTYTSEERFDMEWNTFFQDYPQIVGMSGDLPGPDTFLTTEDFGVPVLAVRDSNGKFKAYANVCAHRGVTVEANKRGEKTRFSCPFHGWTFNNDGELVGYPKKDQFGEIDKACYGLKELPATEKFGFLWVHPSREGTINFEELLGEDLVKEFESWNFESLVFEHQEEYVTDMNWKLAIDTFGETYHFSVLHKDSLHEVFHGNCQMFDNFNRNGRLILCRRAIDEMRKLPESDWNICAGTLPVYYLFPNIIFMPTQEGAFLVQEYPLENSPHKSVSKISFSMKEIDFKTPFPLYLLGSLSLSSTASNLPVEAPDGTIPRADIPESKKTSASTVGFPLESNTSYPFMFTIVFIIYILRHF